jgi:predicted SnoaL-like aldol condensation-catalyzing enzyme
MVTSNTLADLVDQPTHTADQERKIKIVFDLFTNVFVNFEEFDQAPFGEVYIQHNPGIADGTEGLRPWAKELIDSAPDAHIEYKRFLVDGDYVTVHTHVKQTPDHLGVAVFDLFRIKDDKVVEHWDIWQEVPEKPANTNTMF